MAKGEFQLYIEHTFPEARVTKMRKIPVVLKILLRENPTLLKIKLNGEEHLLSSCGKVSSTAPELSSAQHTWLNPYFQINTLFKEIYQGDIINSLCKDNPFLRVVKDIAKQQLPYGPLFPPTPLSFPGEKKQKANSNKKK